LRWGQLIDLRPRHIDSLTSTVTVEKTMSDEKLSSLLDPALMKAKVSKSAKHIGAARNSVRREGTQRRRELGLGLTPPAGRR
jgi:hypothetical protein